MKAEEVGKATPRTLTRISEWINMDGAKYTLLVEWKTKIVAKVNSYGNFGLIRCGVWYLAIGAGALRSCVIPNKRTRYSADVQL